MQTTGTASETLFCGICRRATADGICERCGEVRHGFVQRLADARSAMRAADARNASTREMDALWLEFLAAEEAYLAAVDEEPS